MTKNNTILENANDSTDEDSHTIRFTGGDRYSDCRFEIIGSTLPAISMSEEEFVLAGRAQLVSDTLLKISKAYHTILFSGLEFFNSCLTTLHQLPLGMHPVEEALLNSIRSIPLTVFLSKIRTYSDFINNSNSLWKAESPLSSEISELKKLQKNDPHYAVMWALRNHDQHEEFVEDAANFRFISEENFKQAGITWQTGIPKILYSPHWNKDRRSMNTQKILLKHLDGISSIDILEYVMKTILIISDFHNNFNSLAKEELAKSEEDFMAFQNQFRRICAILGLPSAPGGQLLYPGKAVGYNVKRSLSEFIIADASTFIALQQIKKYSDFLFDRIQSEYSNTNTERVGLPLVSPPKKLVFQTKEEFDNELQSFIKSNSEEMCDTCKMRVHIKRSPLISETGTTVGVRIEIICLGCGKEFCNPTLFALA